MLLRYPLSASQQPEQADDEEPPVLTCAIWLSRIWRAGTLNPDAIETLSGFGAGGAATKLRCLQVNAACPLCERSLDREPQKPVDPTSHRPLDLKLQRSLHPKLRSALLGKPQAVPHTTPQDLWRSIRLTRWPSCTVAVVFRPYTKLCGHQTVVRRRLVEFLPGSSTLGDLDDCFRDFLSFDERDRKREQRHFAGKNMACYIWRDGRPHAQIRQGMHQVGVHAAEVVYHTPPYFMCRLL